MNLRSISIACACVIALGCNADRGESNDAPVPTITSAQIAQLLNPEDRESSDDARPVWASLDQRDGRRVIIHARIEGTPDLAERAIHETTCGSIAQRVQETVLEDGQVLEVYLVFDSSVHVCR